MKNCSPCLNKSTQFTLFHTESPHSEGMELTYKQTEIPGVIRVSMGRVTTLLDLRYDPLKTSYINGSILDPSDPHIIRYLPERGYWAKILLREDGLIVGDYDEKIHDSRVRLFA